MDREQLLAEIKTLLSEELKSHTQPLKDQMANAIPEEQKEQLRRAQNEVTQFVQEHPIAALALAAAAGFLLGRLFYKGND